MSFGGPWAATGVTGAGAARAGFWPRAAAAIIDGVILGLTFGILSALLRSTGYGIAIVLGVAYFTLMEGGPSGQTLGKRVMEIRVVDLATGGPIGYGRGFVRYVGRFFSSLVLYLGYLWMLWDGEKQCWHDKLAKDVVVPVTGEPA